VTRAEIPSEGELICMKENDSVLYINAKYQNCDTIFKEDTSTSLKQLNINSLSIFPNPIENSSILKLGTSINEPLKIEIYDYIGILIKVDSFREKYPLGMINLSKGIYFCRVTLHNKIIGVNKIIVK
jgi:Secretion system C-terminal sorting domain